MGINRWGDNHQQTNSWSPPSERMHWDVIWVVQVLGLSRISLLKSYREAVRVESSILASPQLLVIERSHGFGAVRLEKKRFLFQGPDNGCYCLVATAWLLLLGCYCLFAAACLLLVCCLPAARLRLACTLPGAASCCCCCHC